jgi:hypothetical protein
MIERKATLTWKENGIIHMVYKPHVVIDIDVIKQAVHDRTTLSDNTPQLFYLDARDVKYWTFEAKKYGFTKEAISLIKAGAVVLNSSITRISWNWATSFFKLSTPTKVFPEKEPALEWLEKFR